MATSTTNLGLIKPAGSDKIRIAQINQNSDLIDAAVGPVGSTNLQAQANALKNGMAIVSNNNTHAAITAGQYVYVYGHGTLSEGLYVATANIGANGSLSGSNVTAVSGGGLNALNAKISTLNSKFTIPEVTDLDNATENNMAYRFNAGALHNPGYNYGIVFVLSEGNNVRQFAVSRGGTDTGTISMRSRSSTSEWGSWQQLALNKNGTWTPTIERATVSNAVGKYQKIGNLYICAISFDLSAVEAGAPYVLGSSLPGYTSGTFMAIEGNWSSTGNEYGEMGNTSNNNVWFSKNGAVYGLTGSVDKTVRCTLTYLMQ